jgi:molybdenum cofactor cytidylyltransferase
MRAAIVLAAGASQRMGSAKALLPWGATTLLGSALRELRTAGAEQVVVVLGLAHQEIVGRVPELAHATVVLNLDEASGRSGSIRIGASALPDGVTRVVVQSVDQPVPAEVLRALFDAEGEVAVPTFEGRRGHPVCVAGRLLPELRTVSEADHGLRGVVRRHALVEVVVHTPAVTWNLNDPESYAAARIS